MQRYQLRAPVKAWHKALFSLVIFFVIFTVFQLFSGSIFYRLGFSDQKEISFKTIDASDLRLIDKEKEVFIARSHADLDNLIKVFYTYNALSKRPTELVNELTKTNFSRYTLIAVFAGRKPSGGYGVKPVRATENDNKVTIYMEEISPGSSCIVPFWLTYPFSIFLISATDKDVEVINEQVIKECRD
jgi:hypothetical protein